MITSFVTSQNPRKKKGKKTLGKYNWMVSLGAIFDFVAIFLLDDLRWCNLSQLVSKKFGWGAFLVSLRTGQPTNCPS
jgi:hypothetical protein